MTAILNLTVSTLHELVALFKSQGQEQFNGVLGVHSSQGIKWSFHYWLGRLIWANGGEHPGRRWRRNLTHFSPRIGIDNLEAQDIEHHSSVWDYQRWRTLITQKQITREKAITMIKSTITEVLFDLVQKLGDELFTITIESQTSIKQPIILLRVEEILRHTKREWEHWCDAGLAPISPNLALTICKSDKLRKQLSSNAYKNLLNLGDGSRTLRDLSVQIRKDLLLLTQSLIPYLEKHFIRLVEVPDLPLPKDPKKETTEFHQSHQNKPLIACIDDSLQTAKIMEQIVTKAGYRFMSVQDDSLALTSIIAKKPDLIFLDLVMPIANGYEVCTQIRRISYFKNTPIVILTSQDGIFDRVRANIVGASGFSTKPIDSEVIFAILDELLSGNHPQPISAVIPQSA